MAFPQAKQDLTETRIRGTRVAGLRKLGPAPRRAVRLCCGVGGDGPPTRRERVLENTPTPTSLAQVDRPAPAAIVRGHQTDAPRRRGRRVKIGVFVDGFLRCRGLGLTCTLEGPSRFEPLSDAHGKGLHWAPRTSNGVLKTAGGSTAVARPLAALNSGVRPRNGG